MTDVAANQTGPGWRSYGETVEATARGEPRALSDGDLAQPGSLTPAEGLARLLDRRERQVAHMLRGMSGALGAPDEWRDQDQGAGRLNATLLAETQLLIDALRAVHPELRP